MLKDEFQKEEQLRKRLDDYRVDVPQELACHRKRNKWDSFLAYLASPAKDPLAEVTASAGGHLAFKIIPVAGAVCIAVFQALLS
ncbi:hypothetical protein [Lysinibacillus sp. 3P01SB]|uniref:hypothetical protein n=1 Tax=Lysinibacillus sp. 3P01SB TaxID=3132284 RepID=UPI0039A726D5